MLRPSELPIGYKPEVTKNGTTYYATVNGGSSTQCRRMPVSVAPCGVRDGLNVHGALSRFSAAEEMAKDAIAKATGAS